VVADRKDALEASSQGRIPAPYLPHCLGVFETLRRDGLASGDGLPFGEPPGEQFLGQLIEQKKETGGQEQCCVHFTLATNV
jgi:hypothetical protein